MFFSFQGIPTRWPQKYQSALKSVKLHRTVPRSRTSDDENSIQIATNLGHQSKFHQSRTRLKNVAVHSKPTNIINRRSIAGSLTGTDVMIRRRVMNAAWQTTPFVTLPKTEISSNNNNNLHPTTRFMPCEMWTEQSAEMMERLSNATFPAYMAATASLMKSSPAMHRRRVKNESHGEVASSTAASFSSGRLQAVSENCCQFLYSLICFHFCMQVSLTVYHSVVCTLLFVVISKTPTSQERIEKRCALKRFPEREDMFR